MRDAWGVAVFRLGASAQLRAWGGGGGGIRSEFEELPPEACSRLPAETPRGRSAPHPHRPPTRSPSETRWDGMVPKRPKTHSPLPHLQAPSVQTFASSGPLC